MTDTTYDVDLQVEFDRQVATLLDKGYPALTGMAEAVFARQLTPLRDLLPERAADPASDLVPFAIVITGVARDRAFAQVALRGREGFTTMEPDDLAGFHPLADLELPPAPAYLVTDIDTGRDTLDLPPDDAMPKILAADRSPLTLDEGIALVTHHPDALLTGDRFSMLGSRCGDRRVTAVWVSKNRPRLGWCWAGAPHTWLGSASCATRLGVMEPA